MEKLVFLLLVYGTYGSKSWWNFGETIKKTGGQCLEELKKIEWKKDVNEIARDAGKKLTEVGRGIKTGYMEQKDFDQLANKIIEKEFTLDGYADRWTYPMSKDTTILAEAATHAKKLYDFHECLQDELFWQEVESLLEGKDDCLYNVNEKWQGILEWISTPRRNKRIEEDKNKSEICLQTKAMLRQQIIHREKAKVEVQRRVSLLRIVACYMYLKAFYIFGNSKENFTEKQVQYLFTIFHVVQECGGGPFGFDEGAGQFFYNDMFMKVREQLKEDYGPFFDIETYTSQPLEYLKLNLEEVVNFNDLTKSEIIKENIRNIIQRHNQEHSAYNLKRKRKNKCCSSCCNNRQQEIVQYAMKPEKQNMLVYDENDSAINN